MIYNQTKYNDEWNTYKLDELGDFARGKSKHRPRNDKVLFSGGGYPLIQTGDVKKANLYISEHSEEYNEYGLSQSKLWEAGTLCITIAANIAETGLLKYPMCFPDSVVGFRAYQNITSELFMHYVFTYIKQSIQKSVVGSIQDNINIEYLENLSFKIPDIEYQKKIISVLQVIDERIELNTKIIDTIDSLIKDVYLYWFIQCDFPDNFGKPYKTSGGKMKWSKELDRNIPESWEVKLIGDILGKIPNTAKIQTSEYLDSGEIPVIDQGMSYISGYTNNQEAVLHQKSGYIVFGDHTRVVKYIRFPFARGADGTQVLDSTDDRVPNELLYSVIKSIDLSNQGYARHYKFLKETATAIPDKDTAVAFRDKVIPFYEKQKQLLKENRVLTDIREWVLPLLMNGEVTIE